MNNQFSENLKKIRKEHNLSQEELAQELGVSRQAISKWESAQAYPEMDKIIALCNKFNVNIDDLLHNDIKEVKGEEESKKKINVLIDDFLKFITDTINLFSNMNFKSKIKCLFEQVIIMTILFLISLIIVSTLNSLFLNIFGFLPYNILHFIERIFHSILIIFCLIASVIILSHIFKTRYLDYYDRYRKENDGEKNSEEDIQIENNVENVVDKNTKKNNKLLFKKNEDKIIIRDPKHSEYKFINGLFKVIILMIKFFLLCFAFSIACVLISLFVAFILSFLVYKTGTLFIGLLLTILSSGVIIVIILLLILNFVFNRKNNKKTMIWGFISSLILLGIGIGLISIGALDFEVMDANKDMLKVETKEHDMKDDLVLYPYSYLDINYVEADINNIKIEYSVNKLCDINEHIDDENSIVLWGICKAPFSIVKEFISYVNDKKIILVNTDIESITIYANKTNIEKLKNNRNKYIEERNYYDETIDSYEREIDRLADENDELRDRVYDLEEELRELRYDS